LAHVSPQRKFLRLPAAGELEKKGRGGPTVLCGMAPGPGEKTRNVIPDGAAGQRNLPFLRGLQGEKKNCRRAISKASRRSVFAYLGNLFERAPRTRPPYKRGEKRGVFTCSVSARGFFPWGKMGFSTFRAFFLSFDNAYGFGPQGETIFGMRSFGRIGAGRWKGTC